MVKSLSSPAVGWRYSGCAAHKDRGPAVCTGTFAPGQETDRRLIAELRQQVLAPEAIAKIRIRVRELLQDLQRRGSREAEAHNQGTEQCKFGFGLGDRGS